MKLLEANFPGTWEKLLWVNQRPFPDDKLGELEKVSKEVMASLWSVIMEVDFVKGVADEDERINLSHALFRDLMRRVTNQAQKN